MIDFQTVRSVVRSITPFGTGATEVVQECPHCGFQGTNSAYDYCPRDGSRLKER